MTALVTAQKEGKKNYRIFLEHCVLANNKKAFHFVVQYTCRLKVCVLVVHICFLLPFTPSLNACLSSCVLRKFKEPKDRKL